jgi:predicted ATPase/DNA-binding SARP family transcriptional activator
MSHVTEFRVLGPIEAVRDGTPVLLGGRRQRALLALLLLDPGRPVANDRLVDELWQGRPPAGAATTLRAYASKLRSVLGADASLARSGNGYVLDIEPARVDSHRFEQLAEDGRTALARGATGRAAEQLRAAVALWRGRPFDGVGEDGALRVEADRLEQLRLLALEDRIEADLALGLSDALADELEALVREHPYRERLWRQLMLALYRADRQADALAAYRRARSLLDEELGLEPSEELQRLEHAILRHEVPPARPPEERHNLPAATTSFIGRESELAEVGRLLAQTRMLTLTGVGGVGKTRLALAAAGRALPDFAEVAFVDLSALTEPELMSRHVASVLDVSEADEPLHELLAVRLREVELLLVLDNCEHVRDACADLAGALLAACPRLRVLATSREVLGVPGETDYSVPPLGLPGADAGEDELRSAEAVRLLLARARSARPQLEEDASALASAARIARDLDGLPLALELAAARAKVLSLDDIAARLGDRFRFLVSWRRLTAARHRTLEAAMDWSYELLADDERALLAHLSVFAGGFTLPAVAAVCLADDDARALELVDRLVNASLVIADAPAGGTRYRLLETVRQYAAERLDENGADADEARRAHACFFAGIVEAPEARSAFADAIDTIDREQENFRAAIDTAAIQGDAHLELRLVGGLWSYWSNRGQVREGRARIDAALDRRQAVRGDVLARALNGGAALAFTQGDYDRARLLATEALAEASAGAAETELLLAHNLVGLAAMRLGAHAEARRHLEARVALATELGREPDARAATMNLGVLALEAGELDAAVPLFEEVLAYDRLHSPGGGFAALNLAQARYRLGDFPGAGACFEEARVSFVAAGFRAHIGHALQGLAAVAARAGDPEETARLLGRANALVADIGLTTDDFDQSLVAEAEEYARGALGDERFSTAFDDGLQAQAAVLRPV